MVGGAVHAVVGAGDGRSGGAELLSCLASGLAQCRAGQFDCGQVILVGAGEHGDCAGFAVLMPRAGLAACGMPDADRVRGVRLGLEDLSDGAVLMDVGVQVAVLLAVDLELSRMIQVNPWERGRVQTFDGLAGVARHRLPIGLRLTGLGIEVHPRERFAAARLRIVLAPLRELEVPVHDLVRVVRRIRCGLHAAFAGRGCGLGRVCRTVGRDGTGRVGSVLIVGKLVRLGELHVVQQVAVPRFALRLAAAFDAAEREPSDGRGCDVRAGVGLPLADSVPPVGRAVGDLGGDLGADLAGLVAVPVDGGARRLLSGLLAGFADHDAHAVDVRRVDARVLEAPTVHDAGRGGHVLIERGSGLRGGDLAVMVRAVALVIDLYVISAFEGRIVRVPGLRRMPCELALVESGGQRGALLLAGELHVRPP